MSFPLPRLHAMKRLPGLGLGTAIAALGLALTLPGGPFPLDERLGLDALFALRGARAAPPFVTIVRISEETAKRAGQPAELTKWQRSVHGRLVDRIAASGPAVIVFDLFFEEAASDAREDEAFAAAIARAGNVVLVEHLSEPAPDAEDFGTQWRDRPTETLARAALATADFPLPRMADERVLRYWTFGRPRDSLPTLPVVAVQVYLADAYEDFIAALAAAQPGLAASLPADREALFAHRALSETMRVIRDAFVGTEGLRDTLRAQLQSLPDERRRGRALALLDLYAAGDHPYFNFHGPTGTIRTVDYDAVLRGEVDDFAGQIVLVGLVEPLRSELDDKFLTPYSTEDNSLSGVELLATAAANHIDGSVLEQLPFGRYRAVIGIFGLALGLLLVRLPLKWAAVAALGAGTVYVTFAAWRFAAGVWWPLFVPIGVQLPGAFAAVFVLRYRQVQAQRERVQRALGAYVPRRVVEQLSRASIDGRLDRELLHGTCLFTDAENYTHVAEKLGPQALAQLLDEYYETLFAAVGRGGGIVSDAGGDSMVAVWAGNAPDPRARAQACAAALEILAAVDSFNLRHAAFALPTRVGLESGRMVLGNVGTEQRLEYRAIGDIVNTASRIEGLNRLLGTRALASAAAIEQVNCHTRKLGAFLLRGKAVPVDVFELREASVLELDERFAHALAAFREGAWQDALARFAGLAADFPDDGPIRYYERLAREYVVSPPADWRGVIVVTTK